MRFAPIIIAALSLTLAGCNAAMWGNMVVFAMTVGIFLGTLNLGRTGPRTEAGSTNRAPDGLPGGE